MTQQDLTIAPPPSDILKKWGFWAILFGALSLILVFVQIVGPTFEQKQTLASQIGEMAGEMKRSAWQTFLGLPKPEPEPTPLSIMHYAAMIAPVFGVLAIVLSIVSGFVRENRRFAVYGTSLGVAAIVFQFVWWLALLIAGVALLIAIVENLDGFFSFDIFGS